VPGKRTALLVAVDTYTNPDLRQLAAPVQDAERLAAVLRDPERGGFTVDLVLNAASYEISERVEGFFADARADDLLVLHFSCHGLKDDGGELYLAATNTLPSRLGSTAVDASAVSRFMRRSRARQVVIFLDCCYGGAFERGLIPRAGDHLDATTPFHQDAEEPGRGRAVITASSAVQYAFEGSTLADVGEHHRSVFTGALVHGLTTGEADQDGDGKITLAELYDYVYRKVRDAAPGQTPSKWEFGLEGGLVLARNPRPRPVGEPLLPELLEAMHSPLAAVRIGIVGALEEFVSGELLGRALSAREALATMVDDDSRQVSSAAAKALERTRLSVSHEVAQLGAVRVGSAARPVEVTLIGVPLARAVHITSKGSGFRLDRREDTLFVSADTTVAGRIEGSAILSGPTGDLEIPVRGQVLPVEKPPAPTPPPSPTKQQRPVRPQPQPETPSPTPPPSLIATPSGPRARTTEPRTTEPRTTDARTTDARTTAARTSGLIETLRSRRIVAAIGTALLVVLIPLLIQVLPGRGDDDRGNSEGSDTGQRAAGVTGDGSLRLGTLLPRTGNLAFLGPPETAGVDLAVKDMNEAGGVLGKPVTTVAVDSGDSTTTIASVGVDRLLAGKVDAIIGASSSRVVMKVIDTIIAAGVVQISPSSGSSTLTDYPDKGLFFRTLPSDVLQGRVLSDVMFTDGDSKIAILAIRDDYGTDVTKAITTAIAQGGGEVVVAKTYDPQATRFAAEVGAIKAAVPDAIVLISFDEAKQIVPEMVKQGINLRNVYFVDGNLADYSKDFSSGTLTGVQGTLPGAVATKTFKARLLAVNPNLTSFSYAPESYDAAVLAGLAAQAAKDDSGTSIAAELVKVSKGGQKCTTFKACVKLLKAGTDIDYDGISGPIEFTAKGDVGKGSMGIYQYGSDNRYSYVKSVEGTL
jgi:ABC-type branched-subunit amino acid transport system substrate-binding protein